VRELLREMNIIALRNEALGLGGERPLGSPAAIGLFGIQVPTLVILGVLDRPEIVARSETLERSISGAQGL
jgi:hypothetical protein